MRFAWMAGPQLDVPDRVLTPRDLQRLPMLSLGERSYHHLPTEQFLAAEGGRRRRADTCNSMSIVASLTKAGLGISLLPPSCYEREIADGTLRVLGPSRRWATSPSPRSTQGSARACCRR